MMLTKQGLKYKVALCVAGMERRLETTVVGIQRYLQTTFAPDLYFVVESIPQQREMLEKFLWSLDGSVYVNVSSGGVDMLKVLLAGHYENKTWLTHLFAPGTQQPSPTLQLWRRWSFCMTGIVAHEKQHSIKYDFVGFTRTDLMWYAPPPSLDLIYEAALLNCDPWESGILAFEGEEYGGVNDRFFFTHRANAHMIGFNLWHAVSNFLNLDALFRKLIQFNAPLAPKQWFGIEMLVHMIFAIYGQCILKMSPVTALIKQQDGHARYQWEYWTADMFAFIINQGGSWNVVRAPFLVGARCGNLNPSCCVNADSGSEERIDYDCWMRYRRSAIKVYSTSRCCSSRHVHLAPIPPLLLLQASLRQASEHGFTMDPQVSNHAMPFNKLPFNQVAVRGIGSWMCVPFQPDEFSKLESNAEYEDTHLAHRSNFDNMHIGGIQCYDVDLLLAWHGLARTR